MFRFGVDTFIWTENFTEKDLWVIDKAKEIGFEYMDFAIAHPDQFPIAQVIERLSTTGIIPIVTTTLSKETNLISQDVAKRTAGLLHMKLMVDIAVKIGAKIIGGVNYAAWGYFTGRARSEEEWNYAVGAMREICAYAKSKDPEMLITVECINRFETHFLNVASDGVAFCKAVGTDNIKVHLDCFHMNIEESSFAEAIRTCGKEYLGYMHVNENNRGIPGTGLVPWHQVFETLAEVGYTGPLVIESFDPNFEELVANCAIWRKLAESGEALAIAGLHNLVRLSSEINV